MHKSFMAFTSQIQMPARNYIPAFYENPSFKELSYLTLGYLRICIAFDFPSPGKEK